jgi:hypothetical protein
MRVLAAAVTLVALAFPATAWGEASLVTRELSVGGQRTLAASAAPERFNMVGLHWKGSGTVRFRVRSGSRWSAWREAEAQTLDLPDRGTDEWRRMGGWRIGNPLWTGESDRLEVRVRGQVSRLRAHYVWSPQEISLERSLQMAGSPSIITRRAWGANEGIRRDNPVIARTLSTAILHHTAGAEPASPAQSAAIVRGIYLYHVRGNGWDDIGYNFLVDRFGQIFEGRYGGVERNVVGAHSQGFNTGSFGVSLIGNYERRQPTAAARSAIMRLLSWRLDVAHVDPVSNTPVVSGGNPKFRPGFAVWLRAVSGHRDTGYTSCPGLIYGQLRAIASGAAGLGLPKLYTPEVEGGLGRFVSFSARLSAPLPWTVTITDSAGRTVATGTGFGSRIQWTWDARLAPRGSYRYRMGAGPSVRPATGIVVGSSGGALVMDRVLATPAGFTPNGDGFTDTTTVSYRLSAPASVTAMLQTELGLDIAPLFSGSRPAGLQSFKWDGAGYPDGRYRIALTARGAGGRTVTGVTNVAISRTLAGLGVAPAAISPNGDGRLDTATISFRLSVPASARVVIRQGVLELATVFDGLLPAGAQVFVWPGGVRDGDYEIALTLTDATGPFTQALSVRVDRVAPRLARVSKRPLRVSLSERARVTFVADGVATTIFRRKAGVFRVNLAPRAKRLVASAQDAAGNTGPWIRLR